MHNMCRPQSSKQDFLSAATEGILTARDVHVNSQHIEICKQNYAHLSQDSQSTETSCDSRVVLGLILCHPTLLPGFLSSGTRSYIPR